MAEIADGCPTLSLIHLMGKRWTIPIIEAFTSQFDYVQFNALHSELVGITPKNLSRSLKELCAAGVLKKVESGDAGVLHTSYVLTKTGIAVQKFIKDTKTLGICIYGVDPSCKDRKCIDCYVAKIRNR